MNIATIVKLISMVSLFKDVTEEVKKAGEEKRPWYMQRTMWGAILAIPAALAASFLGVTLDQAALDNLGENIPQLITVGITVYGSVLSTYGLIAKALKKT